MIHRNFRLWCCGFLLGSIAGCQPANRESGATEQSPSSHQANPDRHHHEDHDHHDDPHSHHGQPKHYPHTFAEAVQQLSRRYRSLIAHKSSADTHIQEHIAELKDIIRWLPELAGDSELRKADWERTRDIASELELLSQSWTTLDEVRARRENYHQLVEELVPLAKKSRPVTPGT